MFILNRWFVLIKEIRKPLSVTLTFLTRDLIDFPQILVKKKKKKKEKKKNGLINLYYIHFRITGSPFNLSGSHWLIYSRIAPFFALNRISFPANDKALIKHNNQ